MQILPTLVILGVLISIHELGHFLACRLTGVKVEKFSIGFGPELLAWQGKETRYSLSIIPFGGFVKPQGESEEEVKVRGNQLPGDFLAAPVLSRAFIIVAGVVMNYLLAYVLFVFVLTSGRPMPGTKIGGFVEGYPAQMSALKEGDIVKSINGTNVANWQDMLFEISKTKGEPIVFSVLREDQAQTISLLPKVEMGKDIFGSVQKVPKVGIKAAPDYYIIERYEFKKAMVEGWRLEWRLTCLTYEALWRLVTGRLSLKTVSGPIGIVAMAHGAVKMGLVAVLQFTAVLSLSLAVINLLPIPALDGGHLFFIILEIIFRRPVSLRVQERITQAGFYFLMALMVLVVFNDLANFGLLEKLKTLITSFQHPAAVK
jgi:regulator of sigma E protease